MIEAKDLTKNYGAVKALRGASFSIQPGEIVGLLGPNGAGKSTAMRITTGFLAPTEGTVTVGGVDVQDEPREVQAQIGYLPEGNPLYLEMRLREALRFTAAARGLRGAEGKKAIGAALDEAGLLGREHQIIRSFSRGYRQRVGLATALLGRPPVLILDEPSSGLDPNQQVELQKFLRGLAEDHTVVFSSHILPEVEAVCDRIIVVHRGRIVADGTVDAVRQQVAGGSRVRALVQGSADAARSAFGAVEGVEVLAAVPAIDDASVQVVTLRAENVKEHAVRASLAQAAIGAGLGLVELSVERASLQDVFAALTPDIDDEEDDVGVPLEPMSAPPPMAGEDESTDAEPASAAEEEADDVA